MSLPMICPECRNPVAVDEGDIGTEVQCSRCRSFFVADSRLIDHRGDRSLTRDNRRELTGSSAAVWSVLLGIGSILTFPCCGIGGLIGLAGFMKGYSGLQTPSRPLCIFGMMISLCGVLMTICAIVVTFAAIQMLQQHVPPNADGTSAPFVP